MKLTDVELSDLYTNKIKDLDVAKKKFYHRIVKERREWVISGCNFFYWDDWWKDVELYIHIYYDMLLNTITGNMNTCFFINLFDLPVLNKKECSQFLGDLELTDKFVPVLSACTTPDHLDDLNIYPDAWELVSQKKFGRECRDLYFGKTDQFKTPWEQKVNKIVFRGRNTSCYPNDFEKNIRLKVSKLAEEIIQEKDEKIKIDIDIGLNALTTMTLYHDDMLDYSKPAQIFAGIPQKKGIPMIDQSNCKFILDMDGFVTPWRLCFELSYHSCILLVRSNYISWFYDELIHGENIYMINQYGDVKSELKSALLHFSQHDEDAQRIANGSVELYKKIMNVEYMQGYMKKILTPFSFTGGKKTKTKKTKQSKKTKNKSKKHR
jgi:hypothetical protein